MEGVEAEIERLLQEDAQAEEVVYEMREQVDGMDRFDSDDGATPAPEGAQSDLDMDDNDGEMMDMDEEEEEDEDEEDDEYEKDLLAELEREIGGGENATDEEGGTPQPQERKPVSQPSGLAGSHTSHSAPPRSSVHKIGAPGAGNIGGASGLSRVGEIRSASGNHTSTTRPSSVSFAGSTGVSSGTANQSDKGKAKAQDDDDDEDDDDDDEEEEEEEEDDDDDEDSGSDEDDEDDDEDDKEKAQVEKLLKDEIKELDSKIQENEEKLQSAPNEILKVKMHISVDRKRCYYAVYEAKFNIGLNLSPLVVLVSYRNASILLWSSFARSLSSKSRSLKKPVASPKANKTSLSACSLQRRNDIPTIIVDADCLTALTGQSTLITLPGPTES